MYKIEKLGLFNLGRVFVFSTGKYLIVTNVNRLTEKNTEKIVKELVRMKISKPYILELNMKNLQSELKKLGSLHDYVNIDFEKITNEDDIKDIRHYISLKSDNFGGGYEKNEVKIILL